MFFTLLPLAFGCFQETSHPLPTNSVVMLAPRDEGADPLPPRPWLASAHKKLKHLLPPNDPPALLTDDLVGADGRPVNVVAHFGRDPDTIDSLWTNCDGLLQSAHLTGDDFDPNRLAPVWPGFEQVWIPINDRLQLAGLLGLARRDGEPIESDCVVILPGLFGHNRIDRTRDLAAALVQRGFHALAVELRGHGRTEIRYPHVYYDFGVLEVGDLMVVAEWLQAQPEIRRTGLVGFCWGANIALLAAWYDGRSESHPAIAATLAPHLRPVSPVRHYEAGVLAFSPVLRFEEIIDALDPPQTPLLHPVLASLQQTIRGRLYYKKHHLHPDFDPTIQTGSLRKLIDYEFARSELSYPGSVGDALRFLRLLPYRGLPDHDKLECARVPVVLVQAANDPLEPAQDIADCMAKTRNPNVAAIVLPGGGHVGFAAYATDYYFSLILNFFDASRGPAAASALPEPRPSSF